jgi:hypothetical protein
MHQKQASPNFEQVIIMETQSNHDDASMAKRLRQILLELARREESIACSVAATVPYWAHQPASVSGHRSVARLLRSEADQLLEAF